MENSHKSERTAFSEEQEQVLRERGYFIYQGFHFKPNGQFPAKENTFYQIVKRLRRDDELGMRVENYCGTPKHPYSYKAFYEASAVKDADIFFCLETQKEYVPCENELQEYMRKQDKKPDRGRGR